MNDFGADREDRDRLVAELMELDARIYPGSSGEKLPERDRDLLKERYYGVLGEYSDRLPRMVLSRCPHCGAPLKRAFDPYGLDGPWWHASGICKIEEPSHCGHFQVMLGAVAFHGRVPVEVKEEVRPGPDVPFVVPKLLELPKMVAVVSWISLASGDTALPIAYFSTEDIPPVMLHQPWCRKDYWFKTDSGDSGWSVANDLFDFDLKPYILGGQLKWVDLEEKDLHIHPVSDEECPFLDLPGDRENQIVVEGSRDLIGLPTGEPINVFED
jgi:hypothetical protein